MVIFCACAYSDVVPAELKRRALGYLEASGEKPVVIDDLCKLAARRDPALVKFVEARPLCIVACHPRAVMALFNWADVPLDLAHTRFVNLRAGDAESLAEMFPGEAATGGSLPEAGQPGEWIPWFPVIDRDRCRNCKQCLEFCLFGVYETDAAGRVAVVCPDHCKTNCPACARLCPECAIIFPKSMESPINGAEIADEAAVRAASRALAEGDLRAALEERRKKRRALFKPEYRPGERWRPS